MIPLHILAMWVFFLPSVCDSFCVSTFSLGQKRVHISLTRCMNNPRSCSEGVDEISV